MIHARHTIQIAPGRQADAVARVHEWVAIYKEVTGVTVRLSVVTTGTLGRMCFSSDYESMGAWEAAQAKVSGSPKGKALMAKAMQERRDGMNRFVAGTMHDEIWRDA